MKRSSARVGSVLSLLLLNQLKLARLGALAAVVVLGGGRGPRRVFLTRIAAVAGNVFQVQKAAICQDLVPIRIGLGQGVIIGLSASVQGPVVQAEVVGGRVGHRPRQGVEPAGHDLGAKCE